MSASADAHAAGDVTAAHVSHAPAAYSGVHGGASAATSGHHESVGTLAAQSPSSAAATALAGLQDQLGAPSLHGTDISMATLAPPVTPLMGSIAAALPAEPPRTGSSSSPPPS